MFKMEQLTNDQKILSQFAQSIVEDLKKEIPKATGKTGESIEYYLTQTGFRIQANRNVGSLIEGRKPTGAGYLRQEKTLQQLIYEWIIVKGITPDTVTQLALSWMISRSIHKKGNLLYQRGGANNFLDEVWNERRINTFTEQFSGTLAERTIDYLTTNFK